MTDRRLEDLIGRQLERIAQRDLSVFPEFYHATSGRLYALVFTIVKNREAAEDVLQEVYIKVLNRSEAFDPERGAAWPWLLTIARNTALDRVRARGRRDNFDAKKYLIALEEDEGASVAEAIDTQSQAERAIVEISNADEASAECIKAAFLEGLTYPEIAEREELPLGTVKSRIRRGIRILRTRMRNG